MHHTPVIWTVLPNAAAVAATARERILTAAAKAIAARGEFRLVLAGGTTPQAVYQRLRTTPADWPRWRIWFGDERCLSADDAQRNDVMADAAWLNAVAAQVHRVPPQKVDAGETAQSGPGAVARYAASLPHGPFDLVLLGLGEDGHTASLFPGHDWGTGPDAPPVLAVSDAPKPPPARISLSAARLSNSRQVLFMVTGAGKRAAVAAWQRGAALPAAAISAGESVEVLLDGAADGED